ncbi:MAG: prepilin-type N-terminal cleavage/methylation domain-containing protein [bacterium]
MNKASVSRSAGFTLLEVTVALFIIAVALLAMAKMQTRSIEAAEYSGRMAVALRLAQDVIEQIQSNPFASAASSTSPQVCPGGAVQMGISCPQLLDTEGRLGNFTRTWTVTETAAWPGVTQTNIRQVEVLVTWGQRQVRLTSLLTQ